MQKKIFFIFCVLFLIMAAPIKSNALEEIPIYTYHTHDPFVSDINSGLTFKLSKLLEDASGGRYKFPVKLMSRPQVNEALKTKKRGIIPWVNPAWFKDVDQKLFYWSNVTLMEDGNVFIFDLKEQDFKFDGIASLDGKIIGGLRGHKYSSNDGYLEDNPSIRIVYADFHKNNIDKIKKGLIDVLIMPKSMANYYQNKGLMPYSFKMSKFLTKYERRVIILGEKIDIKIEIEALIKKIINKL